MPAVDEPGAARGVARLEVPRAPRGDARHLPRVLPEAQGAPGLEVGSSTLVEQIIFGGVL